MMSSAFVLDPSETTGDHVLKTIAALEHNGQEEMAKRLRALHESRTYVAEELPPLEELVGVHLNLRAHGDAGGHLQGEWVMSLGAYSRLRERLRHGQVLNLRAVNSGYGDASAGDLDLWNTYSIDSIADIIHRHHGSMKKFTADDFSDQVFSDPVNDDDPEIILHVGTALTCVMRRCEWVRTKARLHRGERIVRGNQRLEKEDIVINRKRAPPDENGPGGKRMKCLDFEFEK